jgi:ABC-type nitrate/sulfonate/bicarbonate transport system substrate-binding protein
MKKIVIGIVVIVVIVLAGLGVWYFSNSPATYSGTPVSITIGNTPNENPALIYIAEDQGYFFENGLNVTLRDYSSGNASIYGLENGETDISECTEFNVVGEAFNKENVSIIANINKFNSAFILGRKDKGIENVSDLRGKKIGVTRGVMLEFFLDRFLYLNGMNASDVTIVNLQSPQYVDALTNGSVDALVSTLYIDQIHERLGNNLVSWPVQSGQNSNWILVCRNDWASTHPDEINSFLKSLDQAEQFTIDHPDEAKAIVQKKLNYTDAYMATIWPENHFSLSLDQSLVFAMEDEGRWMINNDLTTEKTIPDNRNYIYSNGMEKVKPEAVNIID